MSKDKEVDISPKKETILSKESMTPISQEKKESQEKEKKTLDDKTSETSLVDEAEENEKHAQEKKEKQQQLEELIALRDNSLENLASQANRQQKEGGFYESNKSQLYGSSPFQSYSESYSPEKKNQNKEKSDKLRLAGEDLKDNKIDLYKI